MKSIKGINKTNKQFEHVKSKTQAISSLKSNYNKNYINNSRKAMIYNNMGYWDMLKDFDPELKPEDIVDKKER